MTMLEWRTWLQLRPSELMSQAWLKADLKHRCPHVVELTARFNAVSHWVAACVLWPEKLQERVKVVPCSFGVRRFLTIQVVTRLVEVAAMLEHFNNFNGMFEVLSGLSNSAVHRLRFTFQELSKKTRETLARLRELWDSSHNFRAYREALRQRAPPKFPYLGVYLQDLIHIEDGNPNKTADGLINFAKRRLLYRVLREIEQMQVPNSFDFPLNPAVVAYLAELPRLDDDELFRLSLLREPRNVESKASLK